MAENKNGGPAFPATNYIIPSDLETKHVAALGKTQGMTMRDYFAAKAIQGMAAGPTWHDAFDEPALVAEAAQQAYSIADAMLAARNAT